MVPEKGKALCKKNIEMLEGSLRFRYKKMVTDAGYESEENYGYSEGKGQISFIKPTNYESSKTRKY